MGSGQDMVWKGSKGTMLGNTSKEDAGWALWKHEVPRGSEGEDFEATRA